MIVGFAGASGSGKDTAASVLVRAYGFRRLAFADNLKCAAKVIFGLTDAQLWGGDKDKVDPYWNMTPGQICQRLGTECLRNGFADDVWIRSMLRQVEPGEHYVITDLRFPNEAQALTEWGGKIYRIERPGHVSLRPNHISETALNDWPFAATIVNGGTPAELALEVDRIVVGAGRAAVDGL